MKVFRVVIGIDVESHNIVANNFAEASEIAMNLSENKKKKVGATTDVFRPTHLEEILTLTD